MQRVLQIDALPTAANYVPPPLPEPVSVALGDLDMPGSEAAKVEVLITSSLRGASAEVMALFPNLRLVANFGVGLERIALEYARSRSIDVTYTPNLLTDDVADLAMTLTLNLIRRIPQAMRHVSEGQWGKTPLPLTTSPRGKKLGIFGYGKIGHAIERRAVAFGFDVGVCTRTTQGVTLPTCATLMELAAWADVLILAAPGGPETEGVVGMPVLEALGPHGYLVNIARGSLVDEKALAEALANGVIAGAALDVFRKEPYTGALSSLPNILCTPHIASATVDTRAAMADRVYTEVIRALAGQPPLYPAPR